MHLTTNMARPKQSTVLAQGPRSGPVANTMHEVHRIASRAEGPMRAWYWWYVAKDKIIQQPKVNNFLVKMNE